MFFKKTDNNQITLASIIEQEYKTINNNNPEVSLEEKLHLILNHHKQQYTYLNSYMENFPSTIIAINPDKKIEYRQFK